MKADVSASLSEQLTVMRKTVRLPHCLLSFLPGERGVSFAHETVNFKIVLTKPKNITKPTPRQSHTSAKERIWKVVKRLRFAGDKTNPQKLPT